MAVAVVHPGLVKATSGMLMNDIQVGINCKKPQEFSEAQPL
jgi:hypothetical protein